MINECPVILTEFKEHFPKLKPITVAVIIVSTPLCFHIRFITLLCDCGVWQFIADRIFVLSIQVKHLEVSCASMADDICKKSAIIETYVMDSRRGKRLSLSLFVIVHGLRRACFLKAHDVKVYRWNQVIADTYCACLCGKRPYTIRRLFKLIQRNVIIFFFYCTVCFWFYIYICTHTCIITR